MFRISQISPTSSWTKRGWTGLLLAVLSLPLVGFAWMSSSVTQGSYSTFTLALTVWILVAAAAVSCLLIALILRFRSR
jgi:apolipoprotein N-acyltransferase